MHWSIRAFACAAVLSLAQACSASAQGVPSPCVDGAMPALAEGLAIAAGTPVEFEFAAELNSKTSKIDDFFPIRTTLPILIGDRLAIPAGTPGFGQVIHAAKAGMAGTAGELIVAVRCLDVNGVRVPLRRYRDGGIGKDRRGDAMAATALVGVVGFLVKGGQKTIAVGAHGNAIVASETLIMAVAN